jgi:hypothetical protein
VEDFDVLQTELQQVEAVLEARPVESIGNALCRGWDFCLAAAVQAQFYDRVTDEGGCVCCVVSVCVIPE